MGKSKELSEFDRGSIVGCHLCGKSVREIADILQRPKSNVSDVIVKCKRRGSKRAEKRTGRLKIFGERRRRTLKGRSQVNITPQNAKQRLQWCRAHHHWTVDMWKTVLWSDKSRLAVWQPDGRVWVWRMPGEVSLVTALYRLLSLVVEA
ncbi:uncharacterized protein TNCV_3484331 [Trichonephila clavipes]|nr:uncharacterized protein TNCV_3484331 [Trichonephila clavipes]